MSTTSEPRLGPWRITFLTNPDECNLHCLMCNGHSELARLRDGARPGPPRRMELDLVRRVLEERAGSALSEIIPSTMGEPLLFPELDAVLDLCAARGIRVNLTTNGTFPGRGARAWAERLVPVASDVKISWNGATARTAETIMRGLRFEKALEGVRAFIGVRDAHARRGNPRCRVSFQVTVLEQNADELPGIVRLAAALGVDRVKANHVWVHFDALAHLSMRRSAEAIGRWNAIVAETVRTADEARLPSGDKVLLQNVVELAEDPAAPGRLGDCPFLGHEAWVTADGRFAPCPAPGAARGQLGEFGSFRDHTLGEIWESGAFLALQAGYRDRPACRSCRMRNPGT